MTGLLELNNGSKRPRLCKNPSVCSQVEDSTAQIDDDAAGNGFATPGNVTFSIFHIALTQLRQSS